MSELICTRSASGPSCASDQRLSTHTSEPSRLIWRSSPLQRAFLRRPSSNAEAPSQNVVRSSACTCCPSASLLLQPYISSAPRFQYTITPPGSERMIASCARSRIPFPSGGEDMVLVFTRARMKLKLFSAPQVRGWLTQFQCKSNATTGSSPLLEEAVTDWKTSFAGPCAAAPLPRACGACRTRRETRQLRRTERESPSRE